MKLPSLIMALSIGFISFPIWASVTLCRTKLGGDLFKGQFVEWDTPNQVSKVILNVRDILLTIDSNDELMFGTVQLKGNRFTVAGTGKKYEIYSFSNASVTYLPFNVYTFIFAFAVLPDGSRLFLNGERYYTPTRFNRPASNVGITELPSVLIVRARNGYTFEGNYEVSLIDEKLSINQNLRSAAIRKVPNGDLIYSGDVVGDHDKLGVITLITTKPDNTFAETFYQDIAPVQMTVTNTALDASEDQNLLKGQFSVLDERSYFEFDKKRLVLKLNSEPSLLSDSDIRVSRSTDFRTGSNFYRAKVFYSATIPEIVFTTFSENQMISFQNRTVVFTYKIDEREQEVFDRISVYRTNLIRSPADFIVP